MPRRARVLPEELVPHLEEADLVLHAGDLIEPSLLDQLALYAPVCVVKGNLDPPNANLPEVLEFDFGGVRIAMIHDSGRREGRRKRLKRRFSEARVVVFGHSHVPFLEDENDLLLLNPGSPTDKRRQPDYTFALLHAEDGVVHAEVRTLQGRTFFRSGSSSLP